MNVLLVGALGNMGRRYSAILRHLGHTVLPVDIGDEIPEEGWNHAIVATPTENHFIRTMKLLGIPSAGKSILVEKPVVKTIHELDLIYALADHYENSVFCVNQYNYLTEVVSDPKNPIPISWYHYFNHGKDGLAWDCFQIFALAKGEVELDQTSPIWDCGINGEAINLKDSSMDWAYVRMIDDFLGPKKRVWGKDIVMRATERILAYG